jgi:pantetheine-phosphate adenylyltransferase
MMRKLTENYHNVTVVVWDSLIVDFLRQQGIKLLIRGVRGMEDFSYEFEISMMNKALACEIETIFMTTDPEYFVLRSSSIKELASFGGDISGMIPPPVATALREKFLEEFK